MQGAVWCSWRTSGSRNACVAGRAQELACRAFMADGQGSQSCVGAGMNSSWGREGKELGDAVAHHGASGEENGLADDVYVL